MLKEFQVNPIQRLLHDRMGTVSAIRLGVSELLLSII